MLTKSGGCSDTAASMMANRDSDSGQSGKLASKSLCHPHISYLTLEILMAQLHGSAYRFV